MSRRHRRSRRSDSHPIHFSPADLRELAAPAAKWLETAHPLDFLSVHKVRTAVNDATRGAYAEIQWLWEQLEPADPILATCVDRRETALGKIPWDIVKKDGLTDAEDLLAESQLRTLTDFAHALQNLPQAVTALGQASFRSYRHLQLQETDDGSLRFNITDNWNWARDGYAGPWQWNPAATYGLTRGQELPVPWHSIITRTCPRPIDQPAMMLCLDRKNAKAQWLVYNERYGVPPVFAIMPQGIDESLRAEYMEFARQCISNAAGVLPAGSDVKTVTPGTGGPDTFRLAIEMANQELVLRSTGGLMTMLTAPGAGTNTETGNTHQSAFDDLAEAEAAEIAALLQKHVFAPCLRQWHPGQPVLAEFVLRRQESDSTAASVQNIATLSTAGYRTPAAQVADLTGLQVTDSGLPPAPGSIPTIPALNSFARRHSPAILYPPARAAFTRACSALATRLQAESTNAVRNTHPEPGLSPAELAAFQSIAASTLNPASITTAAATAEQALAKALQQAGTTIANTAEDGGVEEDKPLLVVTEVYKLKAGEESMATNCNQYKHSPGCKAGEAIRKALQTEAGQLAVSIYDQIKEARENKQALSTKPVSFGAFSGRLVQEAEKQIAEAKAGDFTLPGEMKELAGTSHAIRPSGLGHPTKDHTELTREEYALIPDIVENYDRIEMQPRNLNTGKATGIKYFKTYGEDTYVIVERLENHRHGNLAVTKTGYIEGLGKK